MFIEWNSTFYAEENNQPSTISLQKPYTAQIIENAATYMLKFSAVIVYLAIL